MLVCDRFVFVHLHKSGGTFVNELMLRCIPSARRIGYHLPYRELPAEHRALPVLGTVRNPWAYYVSWYAFQSGQARPNALFRICSDDRSLDFADTIVNLLNLGTDEARLVAFRDAAPENFTAAGLNLTKTCVDRLRGHTGGFYSFLYQRMYEDASTPKLLRVEELRSSLRQALGQLSVLPDPMVETFLERAPPLNRSTHRPYRDYYTSELRRHVQEADAALIARHHYQF